MAKVNKYLYEIVVQENVAGMGWVDACTESTMKDAKRTAKEYRENGYGARVIANRRTLNPEYKG